MRSQTCLENVPHSGVLQYVCSNFQFRHLTEPVQTQWLTSALGSYSRASNRLITSMENSDLDDQEQCRIINNQIMAVNQNSSWLYQCQVCRQNENNPRCVFSRCVCRWRGICCLLTCLPGTLRSDTYCLALDHTLWEPCSHTYPRCRTVPPAWTLSYWIIRSLWLPGRSRAVPVRSLGTSGTRKTISSKTVCTGLHCYTA